MAAVVACYESTVNAAVHLSAVPPGERVSVVVVAPSQTAARVTHRYIRKFLQTPTLAPLVARDTADEIELSNGVTVVTLPASARSTRGLAVAVLVFDEAAWFVDSDGSPLAAEEIWEALAPATSQFPEGRILVLSTPRWSTGWFANLCTLAESGQYPNMRTWVATTEQMNPRIPAAFLAQEKAKDPAAFRREYEAAWDSGVGAVFPSELVLAAVRRGAPELPPETGQGYTLAIDAAFTADRFAAIVGHRIGERIIVDLVRSWRGTRQAPVPVDGTLDELAAMSRAYHDAPAVIDQFAAEPVRQGLERRGVHVIARPWTSATKVDAVAAVRQYLYAGNLDIPDHKGLVSELVTLEQHPLPSGRPRIAAPSGGNDDFASACMALCLELGDPHQSGWVAYMQGLADAPPPEPRSVLPDGSPLPLCGLRFRRPDGSIGVCAMPQMHPAGGHAEAVEQALVVTNGSPDIPSRDICPPCAVQYRTETGGIDACALPKGHEGRCGPGAALRESPAFPGLSASMWGGR
jgi:hypothetical protein